MTMPSHPPAAARRALLPLTFGALGVVYGDIGTSPLYAFREAFASGEGPEVTDAAVLGVLSLMFWSLILVVTVKYLLLVMRADNDGEGGVLALMALAVPSVRRHANGALIVLGLFGTALLYGDGMITPAISVLSAVEGVAVVAPSFEPFVPVVAAGILIALFSIQSRGTASIGALFGPVMLVWFVTLAVLGAGAVAANLSVLRAVDPTRAVVFVTGYPRDAFVALGAIFLVVTGSEALYADMGHFGRSPIRIGWLTLVFPALVLNYFGQGALLLSDPTAARNPFFLLAPGWAKVPLIGLATLATVIASQALISGAYSLTLQAVNLGYLPRVEIDHTSSRAFGQIYVPAVNWALMVASISLVFAFGSSSALAAAYGVAVTSTMVITTVLLHRVAVDRWGWKPWAVWLMTGGLLIVDVSFFAANLIKVPAGGWVPLVVGLALLAVMQTWRSGRAELARVTKEGRLPLERFIGSVVAHPQRRVPGTAVYLTRDPRSVPNFLLANLRHNEVLHRTVAIVTVLTEPTAVVPRARRVTIHEMGEGFFQVFLRFGFMEQPNVPAALASSVHPDVSFDPGHVTFFLGRERIHARHGAGLRGMRNRLFTLLQRNASDAADGFGVPRRAVMEIGARVEL